MNWTNPLATENQPGTSEQPGREKAIPAPASSAAPESCPLRFRVEVDSHGQVHVHCQRGKEILASVGLTAAGFYSLVQQGLMRKPHKLAAGVQHDWVELDGVLCSFEKGRNDSARLEQLLNERYLSTAGLGLGKAVAVFQNTASATGFDIQFQRMSGGVMASRRQHLNEQALEHLQDAAHCGLLHKHIIIKLMAPNLVFKQRTPNGGEDYLPPGPEHEVIFSDDEGNRKRILLSQPLNLVRFSPAELTAVFNHPAINCHAQAAPSPAPAAAPAAPPPPRNEPVPSSACPAAEAARTESLPASPPQPPPPAEKKNKPPPAQEPAQPEARGSEPPPQPAEPEQPLPNLWLKDPLAQPPLRHDWFACLVYQKLAEHFGNSREGRFGPGGCWFISLGEIKDIEDPEFKGIFLTEKSSLGFLGWDQLVRFGHGAAFIGSRQSAFEGIQVKVTAVGLDAHDRLVFVVSDGYRSKFGAPEAAIIEVLGRLSKQGVLLMSVSEVLVSREPFKVVWTVPLDQEEPTQPQAKELRPPGGEAGE